MRNAFLERQRGKASDHSAEERVRPSLFQYDYLALKTLADDVALLLARAGKPEPGAMALDLGAFRSPYRHLVEGYGYELRTLDINPDGGADYVGTAENTGLPSASYDLVLCTQVLEHTGEPWNAAAEIYRILKCGGHAIITVPHIWFYHPHPSDNWRFTQEGIIHLVELAGLTPIELRAQGGALVSVAQIANFLTYGACGRIGAPVYLLANLLALLLEPLVTTTLFSHNFACLAQRQRP
jgi:SAM-dependent methyltransferase